MSSQEPIFQHILQPTWQQMPAVLHQRYANRANTNDKVVVDGVLNVHVSRWMKFWSPLLRLCGALLPYAGKDIPVQVCFQSFPNSNHVGFYRTFHFPKQGEVKFRSRLVPVKGDEVLEKMRFGLAWKMRYAYEDNKAKLLHKGYVLCLGKLKIPMPVYLILGKAYAYETATSDNGFDMYFEIIHPLFGKIFGYDGSFTLTQVEAE